MKLNHIFLDMDGVIADFFGATMRLFNFDQANYPKGEWDIPKVLGISNTRFWAFIEAEPMFWFDLDPYPWTNELLDLIKSTGIDWTIATSPSRDPKCLAQKVEWLRRFVDPDIDGRRYMMGAQKHLLAAPDRLLIDDGVHNIEAFRKHGGRAIVFPQPWNHWHENSNDPVQIVRERLQQELSIQ